MNLDTPELKQTIQEVMQTLPPVVRSYLSQKKYTAVAQNLMRAYGLRIDQGGVLEQEIVFLLMGIENPDEFASALIAEGKIDKGTVDSIMRDVNNQIFVPLRAEEMKATAASKTAAPASDESHFKLQNKIPLPNRPMMPPPGAQPAAPARPGLRSALSQALGTKQFDPSRMLEDHEEPHIDFHPRPAAPTAPASMPPRTAPPPPNLPGQMPPAPAPRVIPPGGRAPGPGPEAPAPVPPPAAPKAPPPPAGLTFRPPTTPTSPGRYQVDPYREPIDEHEGK